MTVVVTIAVGLAVSYAIVLGALIIARPRGNLLREALRLLPDLLGLLHRLATDRQVPRSARMRLWLLFGYLATPIDLVPDFVPVVGCADDAIVVSLVLRSVVHRAGSAAVLRHWRGSEAGLAVVSRLAGLPIAAPTPNAG
jgi:uncharacterized membrane protein YkvA (DUF1232 family)